MPPSFHTLDDDFQAIRVFDDFNSEICMRPCSLLAALDSNLRVRVELCFTAALLLPASIRLRSSKATCPNGQRRWALNGVISSLTSSVPTLIRSALLCAANFNLKGWVRHSL